MKNKETGEYDVFIVLQDNTEQRKREDQLLEAKRRAVTADRAKSEFLSNMSHELRTPLNAVIGFAEIIERGMASPSETQEYGCIIGQSGRHLLSIIDIILEFARLDVAKAPAAETPVDLPALVDSCAHSALLQAKALAAATDKSLPATYAPFQKKYPARHISAFGEERALRQALTGIILNAVQVNPPEAKIELAISESQDGVKIEVTDHGGGFEHQHLPTITNPFFRGHDVLRGARGGIGLGLTIAQKVVTLHGGRLTIDNTADGAKVSMHLPRERISIEPAEDTLPRAEGL